MNTVAPFRVEGMTRIQKENPVNQQNQQTDPSKGVSSKNLDVAKDDKTQAVPEKSQKKDTSGGQIHLAEIDIESANLLIKQESDNHLEFFVHNATGKQVVQVVNAKTEEVVKQIPPENLLKLATMLKEKRGALLDESA